MMRIRDVIGRELKWERTSVMRWEYNLKDGESTVATLRFRSALGTLATGEDGEGCWTFKQTGFLLSRATIRQCGSEQDLGSFSISSWKSGGTLELPDGRRYPADSNFWATKFEFTDERGEPLVRYRQIGGLMQFSGIVDVQPAAASLTELPWLVMLGWYVTVQLHRDSAFTGAVAGDGST